MMCGSGIFPEEADLIRLLHVAWAWRGHACGIIRTSLKISSKSLQLAWPVRVNQYFVARCKDVISMNGVNGGASVEL